MARELEKAREPGGARGTGEPLPAAGDPREPAPATGDPEEPAPAARDPREREKQGSQGGPRKRGGMGEPAPVARNSGEGRETEEPTPAAALLSSWFNC